VAGPILRLQGIIPALATPFDAQGALDVLALGRLVDRMVSEDVDALFVAGSQGEFYALSPAENERLVAESVARAAGRVPVIAGASAIATRDAAEIARRAEAAGAAAITVMPPSFVRLSQGEIRRYVEDVAAAVSLPIVVYDQPLRTGNPLTVETVLALAAHDRVIAVKDSSGDLARALEYLRQRPPGFGVFVGNDALIAAAVLAGADGAVASTANVAPELCVGIWRAARAGDVATAHALQARLLPLRSAFALGSFPVVVKRALALRGLDVGPTRPPVGPLDAAAEARLRSVLDEAGLSSWAHDAVPA
jgi:4-hydroxy-tetrahydrodipicolinate synthase